MSFSKSTIFTILSVGILIGGLIFLSGTNFSQKVSVSFNPQKPQLFVVGQENNEPFDVVATTLPQFAMSLAEEKFSNLWQAHAQEKAKLVDATIRNAKGDTDLPLDTSFNSTKKEVVVVPKVANKVKPGLYTLSVKVKTVSGQDITITQDFSWGVLAINTNKGRYTVGEQVKIGMAVLDDLGTTKCVTTDEKIVFGKAKVWLTITSPSGKTQELSTDDNTITGSKSCADRSVTNNPDFLGQITAQEVGKYTIHMQAETFIGKESIDDSFIVSKSDDPFTIERVIYPTRIYPRSDYPVTVGVDAHQDYSGVVYDIVPSSFEITDISDNGKVVADGDFQTIQWQTNMKKGDSKSFSYTIRFPRIAPEFYLIGPFTVGKFTEGREWQVASDSIFSLVQEVHNTAASGATISVNVAAATQNHLLITICYHDANQAWNSPTNTPSGGTWTRRFRATSAPRVYEFDKLAPATPLTVVTCNTTNNGAIGIEFLEFSGNSTSGYFDKAGTVLAGNNGCNSGAHQATLSTFTPTNPDELLVSAFAATAPSLTVSAHNPITGASSTGYDDTIGSGFSDANASYDAGWGEAVNNPATAQRDIATFSGAGTVCSGGQVAYNATITISQGSYRFFTNLDSVTPVTPLAAVNTPITLNQPNQPFRLRFLLDIDAATGSLGLDSGDFILEYAVLPSSGDCADGNYNQVTNAVTINSPPIAFNSNPSVTEASNIVSSGSDPADTPTYTTVLETYYGDDNNAGTPPDIANHQAALLNNQAGLWDLSLIDNTDDSVSQTFCLIVTDSSGAPLSAYRNYPKVTTIVLDVNIKGGTTIQGGTTLQ